MYVYVFVIIIIIIGLYRLTGIVSNKKVPLEISLHLCYLHQDRGIKMSKFVRDKKLSAYSKSIVSRHVKMPIGINKPDRRHSNKGRSSLFVQYVYNFSENHVHTKNIVSNVVHGSSKALG